MLVALFDAEQSPEAGRHRELFSEAPKQHVSLILSGRISHYPLMEISSKQFMDEVYITSTPVNPGITAYVL